MTAAALDHELRRLGLLVRQEWLAACREHLTASVASFDALPLDKQVELVYAHVLDADFNVVGAGCLPDVETLADGQLEGRFVVQLDEAVNVGVAAKERYAPGRPAGSMFKLCLTDGVRRCVGMEYRQVDGLNGDTPAGTKLVLTHPHIRRGVLFLTPACCCILGGRVSRLEAARVAARERWNEPPGSAVLQAARARSTNGQLLPPPGGPAAAGSHVPQQSKRDAASAAAWSFERRDGTANACPPGSDAQQAGPAANMAQDQHANNGAATRQPHPGMMSEAELFGDCDILDEPVIITDAGNRQTDVACRVDAGIAAPVPAAVTSAHALPHTTLVQPQSSGLGALFPPQGVEPHWNPPPADPPVQHVPAAKPVFVRASSMAGGSRNGEFFQGELGGGDAQPPQRPGPSTNTPISQGLASMSTHEAVQPRAQAPAAVAAIAAEPSAQAGPAGQRFTYLAVLLAQSGHAAHATSTPPAWCASGHDDSVTGTILGFVATLKHFKHEDLDEYDLQVVLEDGSAAVDARVDGGLLVRRLGVTPARNLKAEKERDDGVTQALVALTQTLQRGFGPIRVRVPRAGSRETKDALMPVILALPDDDGHVDWATASPHGVRPHVRATALQLLSHFTE